MAEYIERQAVLDAIPHAEKDEKISLFGAVADVIMLVSDIPAADVAPVVRRKDCIFKDFPDEYDVCRCERTGEEIQSNDFCSHAVRKEQNND